MAQIETWFSQDLQQAVKVRYIDGNVFSADNNGNIIGVNVFDDGEPAALGGTVSASIIRADGATVAATGVLSGNQVSVSLPQAAYAVPGVISVVVKLTSGTDITTLLAVVGNVYQSATDTVVDPGTILPSIETLIAAIEAAVASIPADYSTLWASLAPVFSTETSYSIGQYVTYNGKLYKFRTAHPAGTWNTNHVVQVSLGNEIFDLRNMIKRKSPITIDSSILFNGYVQSDKSISIKTNRLGVAFIQVKKYDVIHFVPGTNVNQYIITYFNNEGVYVAETGWKNDDTIISYNQEICLIFRNTSNTDITPLSFDALMTIQSGNEIAFCKGVSNIFNTYAVVSLGSFEKGSISSSGETAGQTVSNNNYIRTSDFVFTNNKRSRLYVPDGFIAYVYEYDSNYEYHGISAGIRGVSEFESSDYIKVILCFENGQNMGNITAFDSDGLCLQSLVESSYVDGGNDNVPIFHVGWYGINQDKTIEKQYASNGRYSDVLQAKNKTFAIKLQNGFDEPLTVTLVELDENGKSLTTNPTEYALTTENDSAVISLMDGCVGFIIRYFVNETPIPSLYNIKYLNPLVLTTKDVFNLFPTMERGGLSSGRDSWSKPSHLSSARTAKTIKLNGSTKVVLVNANHYALDSSTHHCYVYFYNTNMEYVSNTTAPFSGSVNIDVPTGCEYMRFMIETANGTTPLGFRIEAYEVIAYGGSEPIEVKNGDYYANADYRIGWFTYDVIGDLFSFGRMILPPNYNAQGAKVPLVLYLDGSGSVSNFNINIPEQKRPYLQYVSNEGFAVAVLFAWGNQYLDKYATCGMSYPYPLPTCRKCIVEGINWICDRFNIDINDIHIMSKSQGGQNALYYSTHQDFPIRSIGMFAPVLDYMSMPGEDIYADVRKAVSDDAGFTGSDLSYFRGTGYVGYSDRAKEFLHGNLSQLVGMNEAWTSLNGGTAEQNFEDAFNDCKTFWTEEAWTTPDRDDLYNKYNYKKMARVPVKIWGASDDSDTPYFKMVEIVKQLLNGGTEAVMREVPRGTGGHSAADVPLPSATENFVPVTTALGIKYSSTDQDADFNYDIPIGWVENVDWIRLHMPK